MLPKKEFNIYPKNDDNLKSLISFYLDKYNVRDDNAIEILKEKSSLSLNQLEFIFRKISEAYIPIFQKHFKGQITVSNLIKYAIDALTETEIKGSQSRILITKEFQQFVKQTETDFNYLEKNN